MVMLPVEKGEGDQRGQEGGRRHLPLMIAMISVEPRCLDNNTTIGISSTRMNRIELEAMLPKLLEHIDKSLAGGKGGGLIWGEGVMGRTRGVNMGEWIHALHIHIHTG